MVCDLEHLHRVEVDQREQPLDRARVVVLARLGPKKGEKPCETTAGVVLGTEVVAGPGIDDCEREIRHPSLAHRLLPARVGPDGLLGCGAFLEQQRRLHTGALLPVAESAPVNRDDGLAGGLARAVVQHDERLSLQRHDTVPAEDILLGRLVERDRDEAVARRKSLLVLDDSRRQLDLRRSQRVERMGNGRRRRRGSGIRDHGTTGYRLAPVAAEQARLEQNRTLWAKSGQVGSS